MSRRHKRTLVRIMAAAFLFAAACLIPADGWMRLALFLLPYFLIGWDVLFEAVLGIARGQWLDEHFLMALATVGALVTGEYPEAVAVMLFYRVGDLFEQIAVGRSRRSIAALMDISPDTAHVERAEGICTLSPDEVEVGEIIVLHPGERVPLDGIVIEGSSNLDTAALTGEAIPRSVKAGDEIISGCINGGGLLRIRVTKPFSESTVTRILELVENSAARKATAEQFITRFARWYTPLVVGTALLVALIPSILSGDWRHWVHQAMAFLVISCPCALVISVPLSFFGGIGGAAKRGILVKGGNFLELLAETDTIVWDKTGTLTEGCFAVGAVTPADGFSADDLIALAALAEAYSDHPIARSLRQAYGQPLDTARLETVEEIPGQGVRARVDGRTVCVGNCRMMAELGLAAPDMDEMGTTVFLAADRIYAGSITISDRIKSTASAAIADLRAAGIRRTVMLTGDSPAAAEYVAAELGIDETHAALLPADKVDRLESLLTAPGRCGKLAFVGDGINDAPVLSRADVGIAMGAMGSDAAIEAADIVLMDDDPTKIAEAIAIARRTRRIVYENIIFALGVKVLVMLFGLVGRANLWAAVFADVGVSVIAICNAMRCLRTAKK
ncbi:MAG: cadmium-translocating P-type ATPase [Clostridia bacterium]|nr:cadmium-translocating P-type ATPase [Clostridia bacterium]